MAASRGSNGFGGCFAHQIGEFTPVMSLHIGSGLIPRGFAVAAIVECCNRYLHH